MRLQPQPVVKPILTQMLQRSLEILQLSQIELAALVFEELDKNPLLESRSNSRLEPITVSHAATVDSFYEGLASQIRESLPGQEEIGQRLLAELDERGFLPLSVEQIASVLQITSSRVEEILRIVKTFDPPGIFASNIQESFLVQMTRQGQGQTLAFQIVQQAFGDFLAGRYGALKKKFRVSQKQLQEAIQQIAYLNLRPATDPRCPVHPIYPDLRIEQIEGKWVVTLLEDMLPTFRLNAKVQQLISKAPSNQIMRGFMTTAKWLIRSIQRRKNLLVGLGKYLALKQSSFLEGLSEPIRLSKQELANKFGVHESTIFRALSGKMVETPLGVIPMRLLVSPVINCTAKERLRQLILQEKTPLTDEKLVEELRKSGFIVARRTIAKYRKQLKIRPSSGR